MAVLLGPRVIRSNPSALIPLPDPKRRPKLASRTVDEQQDAHSPASVRTSPSRDHHRNTEKTQDRRNIPMTHFESLLEFSPWRAKKMADGGDSSIAQGPIRTAQSSAFEPDDGAKPDQREGEKDGTYAEPDEGAVSKAFSSHTALRILSASEAAQFTVKFGGALSLRAGVDLSQELNCVSKVLLRSRE